MQAGEGGVDGVAAAAEDEGEFELALDLGEAAFDVVGDEEPFGADGVEGWFGDDVWGGGVRVRGGGGFEPGEEAGEGEDVGVPGEGGGEGWRGRGGCHGGDGEPVCAVVPEGFAVSEGGIEEDDGDGLGVVVGIGPHPDGGAGAQHGDDGRVLAGPAPVVHVVVWAAGDVPGGGVCLGGEEVLLGLVVAEAEVADAEPGAVFHVGEEGRRHGRDGAQVVPDVVLDLLAEEERVDVEAGAEVLDDLLGEVLYYEEAEGFAW